MYGQCTENVRLRHAGALRFSERGRRRCSLLHYDANCALRATHPQITDGWTRTLVLNISFRM